MKRLILLFGIALAMVACGPSTPKDYYEIEGNVTNVEDGAVFYLFRLDGNAGTAIAHDTLQSGKFYFRITPEAAKEHLTLLCWRDDFPNMEARIWAEAGDKVVITGEDKLVYTWKVKGPAPENRSQQGYIRCAKEIYKDLQRALIEDNMLWAAMDEPNADMALLEAKYDSLGNEQLRLQSEIHKHLLKRMRRCKMDEVGMMHLCEMSSMFKSYPEFSHRKEVEDIFNSLGEEWHNHPSYEKIKTRVYPTKEATIGEPMIDGEFYDLEGGSHTLSELSGYYILLDMWSCGCGPCIMALPEMGEIAEKYKDRLRVVSITTDTDKVWREASERHTMSWHNWSDGKQESGIYAHYDQGGIPNYTLISPEGMIIDRWMGYGTGSLLQKVAEHLE
ncbi:MAG: AhpC/TSA family protein [Tidjanibacter sp.]|nr:AhpC/TSA family protein [Tidjanibacter sp.]